MRTPMLVLLLAALPLVGCATSSPRTTPGARATVEGARGMYLRYCGSCHGPEGKGDGIAGTYMRPKPTDLTQLARANGGSFPFERVQNAIDGTADVAGHGSPEMPVWGQVFALHAGDNSAEVADVRGKLQLLTEYIRSLQVK